MDATSTTIGGVMNGVVRCSWDTRNNSSLTEHSADLCTDIGLPEGRHKSFLTGACGLAVGG